MNKNIVKKEKGYALLFAVLVSAVVLGVGVSILNISRKEILLSAGGQQSQYAFYAADAGYECALYQDYQKNAFVSTTTGPGVFNISCGTTYTLGVPIAFSSPVTVASPSVNQYAYSFNIPVSASSSCAAISVTKTYTINGTTTSISTQVTSDGFNVGWEDVVNGITYDDCAATNPSKVERALQANY